MKPRVCLFTDSIEPSGVGEHMLTLAEELTSEYDIFFLGWSSTALYRRAAQQGFQVYELSVDWHVNKDLLTRLRPDIMHVHAGVTWEGHGGVWAARNAGVRLVFRTEHLPYLITEKWQQDQYTYFLELVDRVICVSEGVRRSFAEAGAPIQKLRLVWNGIRVPSEPIDQPFPGERVRAELNLPHDSSLVLAVGRLTEQKGYDYLLRAACQVAARLPNTHFLLAGEGPLESELKAAAQGCGAERNVHFLGARLDVHGLMRACDLFVLPSLFEGLPLVVLEAMMVGRATVATNVCGTNEAVVEGVTGLLVPPGDAAALGQAIFCALTRPDLSQKLGEAGRERVLRHFTAGRMADGVSAIYRAPGAPASPDSHLHTSYGVTAQAHGYQLQG